MECFGSIWLMCVDSLTAGHRVQPILDAPAADCRHAHRRRRPLRHAAGLLALPNTDAVLCHALVLLVLFYCSACHGTVGMGLVANNRFMCLSGECAMRLISSHMCVTLQAHLKPEAKAAALARFQDDPACSETSTCTSLLCPDLRLRAASEAENACSGVCRSIISSIA